MPILTAVALLGLATLACTLLAELGDSGKPGPHPTPETGPGGNIGGTFAPQSATVRPDVDGRLPINPEAMLQNAILALESRRAVSATIRQAVDLFDQKVVGSGVYLEERSQRGLLLRWEIRTQLAGEPSSLLEVCDGRYLWSYQKLADRETVSRIDVQRVEQALEESGKIQEIGEVKWWPGLAGLPKLLRALHAAFRFQQVEQAELPGQPPVPVWRLRGQWKQDVLADLVPGGSGSARKGKNATWDMLPDHVPSHVVVDLGKSEWFPYRIEYSRTQPANGRNSAAVGDRPLLTLEFLKVNLNPAIPPTQFLYSPGHLEFSDRTTKFLKDLRLAQ